jgi:hypothetical protein
MTQYTPRGAAFMHHTCIPCGRVYAETGVELSICTEREHKPLAKHLKTDAG